MGLRRWSQFPTPGLRPRPELSSPPGELFPVNRQRLLASRLVTAFTSRAAPLSSTTQWAAGGGEGPRAEPDPRGPARGTQPRKSYWAIARPFPGALERVGATLAFPRAEAEALEPGVHCSAPRPPHPSAPPGPCRPPAGRSLCWAEARLRCPPQPGAHHGDAPREESMPADAGSRSPSLHAR